MAVLLVAAMLQLLTVAVAPPPAEASTATGTGGQFVPLTGRLVSAGFDADEWTTIQAAGNAAIGIPATGVNALQVTLTVVNPTSAGIVYVSPDDSSEYTALIYHAGVAGTVSNTAVVALADDGTFGIMASTSVGIIVDVQGYYTDGKVGAGGYVPSQEPARIVDTRNAGTGLPQARLQRNTAYTIQVGGKAGVPVGASAAMINFEVINHSAVDGFLIPYATGAAVPPTSLNYPGAGVVGTTTAMGAIVPLNATTGQFTVQFANSDPSATIDLLVDVVGYFKAGSTGTTPADGAGAFTPAATRVANALSIAAGSTGHVTVAGNFGVPASGSGLRAVAANIQVQSTTTGVVYIGPDGSPMPPVAVINLPGNSATRSNFTTVALGPGGGINIQNASTATISVYVDIQGWYSAPSAIVKGGQSSTMKSVTLQASGDGLAADQNQVTYKYRIGTQAAFQNIPGGASGQLESVASGNPATQPSVISGGAFAPLTWDVAGTVTAAGGSTATPTLVQVEACYANPAGTQYCPAPWDITLTPSLASESTTAVGPGVLSLASGDYTVSATDAAISSSLGGLSISRSADSLNPGTANATASGVFGPGWRADLEGPGVGEPDLDVSDQHSAGYLVFTDSSGTPTVFQAGSSIGTFPIYFNAIGGDAGDGITLVMLNANTIVWTDPDQTTTTWTKTNSVWVPLVRQSGANPASTTTTYVYNSSHLATRILAPSPTGVTCTDANADTTPGCRSLVLDYTAAGHDCGTTQIRLCTIEASLPQTAGTTHKVAIEQYGYSTAGQLTSSFDPRISPNLVTDYDYDSSHRLTELTPPGENAWTFTYDGQRLATVTRTVPVTDPATGTATDQQAVTTVVYGVPLTGTGMPDVSAGTAKAWSEVDDLPDPNLKGTAVFTPDHQPASTDPDHVGTADWPYATIHYLDTNGREVDTADYGAGQWLIDTTQYDTGGNVVWTLDAGNRVQALNSGATATQADLLASTTVYNPLDPSEVTDTYGPVHAVTLSTGASIQARSHVATTYDEGAPYGDKNPATGAAYRLPTTVTTAPYNVATGKDVAAPDKRTDTSSYSAIGTMTGQVVKKADGTNLTDPSGNNVPLTGWALGAPTKTTVGSNAGGLSTYDVYDGDGREIGTWLPGDTTGTTPRTTKTAYYTATGTGTCVSATSAGLVCQTSPGGQPSSGAALPTVTDTYDQWGDVLTQTSRYVNATTTTKTTSNDYDAAGRLVDSDTVVTPEPADDTGLPAVTTTYNPLSGQVAITSTNSGGGPHDIVTTYNRAGEVGSYTDSTGNATRTGYDIDGRPVRQSDGKGTVTLGYDGSGEHRGLVTSEDIGTTSDSTFTAAYDADGNATQTYPGGLTATGSYDRAGNQTGLTYTKGGTTLASFRQTIGTASTGDDHIVAQSSTVDGQDYSSQKFTDDAYGRLTTVEDTYDGSCTTRAYDFDDRSNRTMFVDYPAATDGTCAQSTTATAFAFSVYDDADRLTDEVDMVSSYDSTYDYDVLGRTSMLPGADAVGIGSHHGASGDMALGYYSNDMVASQAQGSGGDATVIAFGLDPDQNRVLTEATTTSAGTKTVTNHYDDASDETAWTSTLKADGTTVTKRYVDGIDGNLDATVADDGTVRLDLTNLHGDTVATIDPAATSLGNYQESTEYGAPRDAASAADDYGWLGAKKRSSDDLGGLTLMGVRLYNPATGGFLSVDPIFGGNANAYNYPDDPINDYDLTGKTTRDMDDTNPPKTKKGKKKSNKEKHGGLPSAHKISQAYPPVPGNYTNSKKKKKESTKTHIVRSCESGATVAGLGMWASGAAEATGPGAPLATGLGLGVGCIGGIVTTFWN